MKTIQKDVSLEVLEKIAKEQNFKQAQAENAQKLVKKGVLSTEHLKTIEPKA